MDGDGYALFLQNDLVLAFFIWILVGKNWLHIEDSQPE